MNEGQYAASTRADESTDGSESDGNGSGSETEARRSNGISDDRRKRFATSTASHRATGGPFFRTGERDGRLLAFRSKSEPNDARSDADDRREESRVPATVLLAPFVVSVTFLVVELLVGPEPFDTGGSGASRLWAFLLLGGLLHLSAYATARLYADARRVSRLSTDWNPNPWIYVFGGATALVALRIAEMVHSGRSISSPVLYLAGNAIVALPLATIVAGPVYWLRRRLEEPTK